MLQLLQMVVQKHRYLYPLLHRADFANPEQSPILLMLDMRQDRRYTMFWGKRSIPGPVGRSSLRFCRSVVQRMRPTSLQRVVPCEERACTVNE